MRRWTIALCKALDLDPSKVRSITLQVSVDKPVTVLVEQFVQIDQVPKLETLALELTIKKKE